MAVLVGSGGEFCEFEWSLEPGVHPMRETKVSKRARIVDNRIEPTMFFLRYGWWFLSGTGAGASEKNGVGGTGVVIDVWRPCAIFIATVFR